MTDFCGDNIKPGFMVSKERRAGENWVKYRLNVSGQSGKLKTTVIGDFMVHDDLLDLEKERQDYFTQLA